MYKNIKAAHPGSLFIFSDISIKMMGILSILYLYTSKGEMNMEEQQKTLGYYMSLVYPTRFIELNDGGFKAMHPMLHGCSVTGTTITNCLEELKKTRRLWMIKAMEEHMDIPKPDDYPYLYFRYVHVYSEDGIMLYSVHIFLDGFKSKKKNKKKKKVS